MDKQPFTTVSQAIEWIDGLRYDSAKNGIENMHSLMAALGNPQRGLQCVHVAGTNGKGSTCAMAEKMLRACGLKTGLYTSPYLMRYAERMRVNGVPIDDGSFVAIAQAVREQAEALAERGVYPTWFELGTAIALCWFAREHVDIAVIEVGLGGRLDATNVIDPDVCLIGPIDLEHTAQLGNTLETIAGEKAGIIKPNVPVIVQRQKTSSVRDVFIRKACELNAPMCYLGDDAPQNITCTLTGADFDWHGHHARISIPGRHQVDNACLALAGLEALQTQGWRLPWDMALTGLSQAAWPARLEWLTDGVLLDGAHNPHGFQALAAYVAEFLPDRRIITVMGIMGDKNVAECIAAAAGFSSRVIATQVSYGRAMPAGEIAARFSALGVDATAVVNPRDAADLAISARQGDEVVLICGSLYLAGDVRLHLKDDKGVI